RSATQQAQRIRHLLAVATRAIRRQRALRGGARLFVTAAEQRELRGDVVDLAGQRAAPGTESARALERLRRGLDLALLGEQDRAAPRRFGDPLRRESHQRAGEHFGDRGARAGAVAGALICDRQVDQVRRDAVLVLDRALELDRAAEFPGRTRVV